MKTQKSSEYKYFIDYNNQHKKTTVYTVQTVVHKLVHTWI